MSERTAMTVLTPPQRDAITSPLRLEIIGLFEADPELSVADLAGRMGVPASSLYHHVGILERVGLLRRTGSRRKGKRDEALYGLVETALELPLDDDPRAAQYVQRAVTAALRMAERDLAHALERDDLCVDGPSRELFATRTHIRASPALLAKINEHLDALFELLMNEGERIKSKGDAPSPDDSHVSLTIALLPLKGRRRRSTPPDGDSR